MKSLILGIFAVTIFFGEASAIYAQCSCANAGESAYDELKRSEAVFLGEVVGIKKVGSIRGENADYAEFDITFKIKTAWRTDLPEFFTIRNIEENDDSDFREKESYLVYVHIYRKVLYAHLGCCTKTKRLLNAAEDLKEFEERGEKPTRVIKASRFKSTAKPNNSFNRSANNIALMR